MSCLLSHFYYFVLLQHLDCLCVTVHHSREIIEGLHRYGGSDRCSGDALGDLNLFTFYGNFNLLNLLIGR